jgi:RNA polymerase sigma factor (sigma-70 family)
VAASVLTEVIRHIGRLARLRGDLASSDEQLLRRFLSIRDEAAFSALVSRHGPMVLGVCRQLLQDPNDVDDAFQATFLVLVRKVASIRKPELLGNWLYGVAYKVAVRARANTIKRRTREQREIDMTAFTAASGGAETDLRPVIHEEVHRLPNKYRAPVLLCHIEGKSHEEAAQQLQWPIGTVKGRLARAKEMLRSRLARRGMTLSAASLGAILIPNGTSAAVPAALLDSTVKAALFFAAGKTVAVGVISAQTAALTKGVLQTMIWTKLKLAAMLILTLSVTLIGGGAGVVAYRNRDNNPPRESPNPTPLVLAPALEKPKEDKEAIQGTWSIKEVLVNGHAATTAKNLLAMASECVISADKMDFKIRSKEFEDKSREMPPKYRDVIENYLKKLGRAKYVIDPKKAPKTLDLTYVNVNYREPTGEGTPIPCVYELKGDSLRICAPASTANAERPTAVASAEDSETLLLVMERKKPEPVEGKDDHAEDQPKPDKDALHGAWRVTSVEKKGKDVDDDQAKKMKEVLWEFDGQHVDFTIRNKAGEFHGRPHVVLLDADKKPKEMDIYPYGANFKRTLAIYSLEGNVLKICVPLDFDVYAVASDLPPTPRPTDFATKSGDIMLLALLRVPAEDKKEEKSKADKNAIQGAWRVVSVETNGKEVNDDETDKIKDVHWSFSDGRIGFRIQPKPNVSMFHSANYNLDTDKKPHEIDIVPVDFKGKALAPATHAIFSLDGDVLRICTPIDFNVVSSEPFAKTPVDRPTEFGTKDGGKTMLLTLHREKGYSEYDYPGAKDNFHDVTDTRLNLSRMLSADDIESVRKWYEKKLGIEHDDDLGHGGTRAHAGGGVVSEVASDSTDQKNGVTSARPVKVYILTQDSAYHWLQIVLTRAEGEKQTHIAVTYVPKK